MWMGGRSLAVYSHNRVIAHRELSENRANRVAFKPLGKHGNVVSTELPQCNSLFKRDADILYISWVALQELWN